MTQSANIPRLHVKRPERGRAGENDHDNKNEVGETTRESFSKKLSLSINQLNSTIMIKRICLHLTAFAVLLPCVLVFNVSGEWWVNVVGIIYCCYLVILMNESKRVQRFVRRYYREILRLQNMM